MQNVSDVYSVPLLARDAFLVYMRLLERCCTGSRSNDDCDGRRLILEATDGWRNSVSGLSDGDSGSDGAERQRSTGSESTEHSDSGADGDNDGSAADGNPRECDEPSCDEAKGSAAAEEELRHDVSDVKARKSERKRLNRRDRRRAIAAGKGAGAPVEGHSRYIAGVVNSNDDGKLADSVREKWILKNRLEAIKTQREISILEGTDVSDEIKRHRTRVVAATERNMVNIEKTHGLLKRSGNSSIDDDDRVHTVLSDANSGSISPNSSASMAEFMKVQKEKADVDKKLADVLDRIDRMERGMRAIGVDPDMLPYYRKDAWTVDSNDQITKENDVIMEKLYPGGYAIDGEPILDADGKTRVFVNGLSDGEQFMYPERYAKAPATEDDSDGKYGLSRKDAMKWLERFEYVGRHVYFNRTDEQVASVAKCSLKEVVKWRHLDKFVNKLKW